MVLLWTITLELEDGFSFKMYISNRSIQHFILFTFDPLCGSPFIFRLQSCFGCGDTGFVDSDTEFPLSSQRSQRIAFLSNSRIITNFNIELEFQLVKFLWQQLYLSLWSQFLSIPSSKLLMEKIYLINKKWNLKHINLVIRKGYEV